MEYLLATKDHILGFVKGNCRLSNDDSDEYLLDAIGMAFNHFRNLQTLPIVECWFDVCSKEATLPTHVSNILWVKIYDTDLTTELCSWYMPTIYKDTMKLCARDGSFDLDGNKIRFYTDGYDGKKVKVKFRDFLTDEDGEMAVPKEYLEGVAAYATYLFYQAEAGVSTNNMHQNIALNWKKLATDQMRYLRGKANMSNVQQNEFAGHMLTGSDMRYSRNYWGWSW